jgi:hypothetical protein
MAFGAVFVVLILLAIVYAYVSSSMAEVEYVKSTLDGKDYLVQKRADAGEAADLIASVTRDMVALVKHMAAKFPDDPDVRRLVDNFDPAAVSEGSATSGYTSYTVDKGANMVMCVRQDDERGTLVDKNVVLYVAIHELGHIMTSEIGHTDMFWSNNRRLLKEAIAEGIYTRTDFAAAPAPYCGIQIKSSVA